MGTRTYSRRGKNGRVATAYGVDRYFNTSGINKDMDDMLDEMKDVSPSGRRDRETGLIDDGSWYDFVGDVEAAKREDGTWDVKELQRIIQEADSRYGGRFKNERIDEFTNSLEDMITFARDGAQERAAGQGLEFNLIDFLNEIGRESGAPGFFDRMLRGEPMQTPQAIAETQRLASAAEAYAKEVNGIATGQISRGLLNPDTMRAAQTELQRAFLLQGSRLTREDRALLGALIRQMNPSYVQRANNRIMQGLQNLEQMSGDVATALRRGTNAGIDEALERTTRADTGLRTTIDIIDRGARAQANTLNKIYRLAEQSTKPGFPPAIRQAVANVLRNVPLRAAENASDNAMTAISRIGRTGVLPSMLSVAAQRNLGGRRDLTTSVVETAQGIQRAKDALANKKQRTGGGKRTVASTLVPDVLRRIERITAVERSGR